MLSSDGRQLHRRPLEEQITLSSVVSDALVPESPPQDEITQLAPTMPVSSRRADTQTELLNDFFTKLLLNPPTRVLTLRHHRENRTPFDTVYIITALAFSSDGRYIASGSDDATIIIRDAQTGRVLLQCDHSGVVHSLAFSPDCRRLVSGSGDHRAIIWDVSTGESLMTLGGHMDAVCSVAYSSDGALVATGSVDGSVRLWDAHSGTASPLSGGNNAPVMHVGFSPDSRQLVSTSADYCARVWNVKDGQLLHLLQGHRGNINAILYTPDSRRLATGSDDGSIRIWDSESGAMLVDLREHTGSVWEVGFSSDGKYLLSAASDGSIMVCDPYGGKRVHEVDTGNKLLTAAVRFTPDGTLAYVASADGDIELWDTMTAIQLEALGGKAAQLASIGLGGADTPSTQLRDHRTPETHSGSPSTSFMDAPHALVSGSQFSSRDALAKSLELARQALRLETRNEDPPEAIATYEASVSLLNQVIEHALRGKNQTGSHRRDGNRSPYNPMRVEASTIRKWQNIVSSRQLYYGPEAHIVRHAGQRDTYADRVNVLRAIYNTPSPRVDGNRVPSGLPTVLPGSSSVQTSPVHWTSLPDPKQSDKLNVILGEQNTLKPSQPSSTAHSIASQVSAKDTMPKTVMSDVDGRVLPWASYSVFPYKPIAAVGTPQVTARPPQRPILECSPDGTRVALASFDLLRLMESPDRRGT